MKKRSLVTLTLLAAVLVGVALVAVRGASRTAPGEFERGPADDAPGAPDLLGRAPDRATDGTVETLERRIALDAALSVRVIEAATKRPVVGARVRATIDFRWTRDRPTGLDFENEALSGADGVARFESFPRRTGVEIRVYADGFRVGATKVTLGKDQSDEEIEVALQPGLPPAKSSVAVGLPAGVTPPGAFVLYDDATRKFHDRVPPGGYVPIEDDPAATVVEHDVAIQLVLPGYAGPVHRRAFRRGTTLTLEPPGPAVMQEILLLDELGRGIEGVDVTVWPLEALSFRARGSAAFGTTDAQGVCRIDGYVGTTWDLALDETKVHATERLYERPVAVGSGPRTIRCLRRAVERFRLDVPGITAPKGPCALDWRSYEPVPGSPVDRLFRADESRRAEAIEEYRANLPTQVEWERDPSGVPGVAIGLVPGTYLLVPSIAGVAGRETTIEVPVGGGEVLVAFAATRKVRVQVTGSIDRADGLLPFGAIVAPRHVGWDERVGLTNQIDRIWQLILARPPRRQDKDEMYEFEHHTSRAISTARSRDPAIGADLVWSGFDGVTEVDVTDEPTELTVMFPGHRAVVVPLEPGSPNLRAHVEPSMFRTFEVRVQRAGGGPFAGYALAFDAAARLRRGRSDLWSMAKADAGGVLRIGFLPGETLGVFRGNDAWTVTPSGGATAERIEAGDFTSYLLTMPAADTPSVTIVVDPYVPRK